ncbi:MAG: hypothetical protein ACJ8KU_00280 [Chthoniobacterales bacterium]
MTLGVWLKTLPLRWPAQFREVTYRPFIALISVAVVVRVIAMIAYFPAVLLSFDSPRYARIDGKALYSDYWMPAGYPLFLRLLRLLSDQLWVTIAVQHLIGLATGVIVFFVMSHLRASRCLACVAAAVPLLSGDHIYLEHMIMADFLLAFLATAGFSLAAVGLAYSVRTAPLVMASLVIGMAALVRSVGLVLIPVLVICTVATVGGTKLVRARALGAALVPALLLLGIYTGGRKFVHGKYLGIADMRGWNLYSRVAPFADCRKFSAPDGTAVLCEQTPPSQRPGPFYYVWNPDSISRRNFGIGPATQKQLGAFATQAIVHQPLDYVRAVVIDLWRYGEPATGRNWWYAGQTDAAFAFGARDPSVEQLVVSAMSRGYRGAQPHVRGEQLLNAYQQIFRVTGLVLASLLSLALIGVWRVRGPLRTAILLFGLGAIGLYILPVATVSYDARYGVPPVTLLVMAGLLAAKALSLRFEFR